MRVGAFYFPTDYGINMAELAKALEDRGFDSLWVPATAASTYPSQHNNVSTL